MLAGPTGYMLTSFGFPLLDWVMFMNSFRMIGNFLAVLNFNRVISQSQPVHL